VAGFLVVGWFSIFHYYSYLVAKLYLQSNDAFQSIRSLLKNDPVEDDKSTSIFDQFRNRTFKRNVISDFNSRKKIQLPSLTQIVRGYFCKEKWFKRFLRLKARGQKKLSNDLDMLRVLKQ
jgi:predicted restriction endonuclease